MSLYMQETSRDLRSSLICEDMSHVSYICTREETGHDLRSSLIYEDMSHVSYIWGYESCLLYIYKRHDSYVALRRLYMSEGTKNLCTLA